MSTVQRIDIPLLPFIEVRKDHEAKRAARARKRTKVKKITTRYPSVNTMYPVNKRTGSKYLSAEGELWRDYISEELDKQVTFSNVDWRCFDCTYVFYMTHEMMFTKAGEFSEHDVSNFLKGTEDALFNWLLESDARVTDVAGHKRLTVDDPKLVILISPASEDGPIYHREHCVDSYDLETNGKLLQSFVR